MLIKSNVLDQLLNLSCSHMLIWFILEKGLKQDIKAAFLTLVRLVSVSP